MNPFDFSDRRVLVVGGSSGIGNGIARAFLGCGARVSVWGTRASAADYAGEAGSDLGGLGYRQVDVMDGAAVDAAAEMPPLDVLVLAQGTVVYGRGEFAPEGWHRVVAVNLDSLMRCAVAFRAGLAERGGSIIVISSVAGFRPAKGNPAYAASKAGAVGLTRTLGQAWAPDGIRVNGIAPGLVDTKLTKVTTDNPARLAGALGAIPAGRIGTPEDMAGAALFLASPLASYVIGQTLIIDGGMSL